MRLQALFSLVPFFLLYGSVSGQGAPAKVLNEATDTFIDNLLAGWNSPAGVSIAVVRKDEQDAWTIETKGYGVATLANGTRVTENTLFAIGSNSKLFDAIAIGLLVTNRTLPVRLSWTSKFASIIPGWGLQDSTAAKQTTILDALSHRTGLPRHDFSYKWSDDVPNIIKKLKSHRPSAEFREVHQYNNNMYTLLSYLPTVLLPSKIPFARYVKQNIFEPLGMSSTTYSYDVAKLGHLADGIARQGINYTEDPLGGTPRALPYWSTKGGEDGNCPGGIISNAVDMSIWLQTLLLEGQKPGTNQSVIPPEVIQKVSAGVSVVEPVASFPELSPSVYGGGLLRNAYRGHEVVWHSGGTPGFLSQISRLPSDNLGIAVLCNDNDYGSILIQIINYRLMDEALGLEKIDWDTRFRAILSPLPPPSTPRPANASLPSANFTALAGMYDNAGYGKVEFCFVSSDYPAASSSCKALAANLSTILPGAVNPKVPTFIGAWDSPWASHIRVSHFDGNQFNVSVLNSFPTNNASAEPYWTYGGDTTFDTTIYAESIVTGRRYSLAFTGFWGAGDIPKLQGETVRDRAEVVFDKVKVMWRRSQT
ncbi:hypothetical protein D9615_009703 [Tricholomella constricta]|uniref:Beta-lactamase-related domain-containing protein n=1 Tax=Tricholomella constricta TaxID=117010 RepID=A0A8H5GUK7_9AGAR|nr:hypothetical protein D9615_009703 [Tricholomella constricta]